MTVPIGGPGGRASRHPGCSEKPGGRWWPDASTPWGAVLYAVLGGLIVWLLVNVLPHVHIAISWH
jgi:hypothetical protein